ISCPDYTSAEKDQVLKSLQVLESTSAEVSQSLIRVLRCSEALREPEHEVLTCLLFKSDSLHCKRLKDILYMMTAHD
ncbi:hypothetical protein A2U01_0096115, partial [Trifolium medium]|nr:hypothetical protein [Trifolium medium]